MANEPGRVRAIAPMHAAYWRAAALGHYIGGPFVDRGGGLITFDAESHELAERLASEDPFRQEHVVDSFWLKQWVVD